MKTKDNKKRNRRTRCENKNKHKLLTQDVQTQDVNNSTTHTVVPASKSKTHGGKLLSSPSVKDQSCDSPIVHLAAQNCDGSRKETRECRLANAMDSNAIEVCCLTETHPPTTKTERWDSGHASLTSMYVCMYYYVKANRASLRQNLKFWIFLHVFVRISDYYALLRINACMLCCKWIFSMYFLCAFWTALHAACKCMHAAL